MENLPDNFKAYLIGQKSSPATVKNYLADVHHFFNWLAEKTGVKQQIAGKAIFALFTLETLNEYKADQIAKQTPLSTLNRRLSSLRKLGKFAQFQGWIGKDPIAEVVNAPGENDILAKFSNYLIKEKASLLTIKNYLA